MGNGQKIIVAAAVGSVLTAGGMYLLRKKVSASSPLVLSRGVRFLDDWPSYLSYILVPSSPSLEIREEFTIRAVVQWLGLYSPEYHDYDHNILTTGKVGWDESTHRYGFNLHYGYYGMHEGHWELIRANTEQVGPPIYRGSGRWEYTMPRDNPLDIWGKVVEIVAIFCRGSVKIYKNGLLIGESTCGLITDVKSTGPIYIGNLAHSLQVHQTFVGIISSISLWNKALDYDKLDDRSGLVLELLLQEGQGNIAHDTSGHNNHGELKEALWVDGG